MCYHKLYLSDEDLRVGYDSIMKSIEHGDEQWSTKLADNLNNHYEFRATVALREKLNASESSGAKTKTNPSSKDGAEEQEEGGSQRIIYCMEFNKGTCTFPKSHVGKFQGKQVTKWHICRNCLKNKELNSHGEKDCKNKKA